MEHEAITETEPEADGDQKPGPIRQAWHRASLKLQNLGLRATRIILPPICLACRAPLGSYESLCVPCWSKITFIRAPICDVLGLPLPYAGPGRNVSAAALSEPPNFDRARAAAIFDGVMRDLIHDFKFHDRQEVRSLFSRWLAGAGEDLIAQADVLVPIPLTRSRLLWRKFNQSAMLAQDLARKSGKTYCPFGLVRIRRTKSQVGLSRAERRMNVKGAFRCPSEARAAIEGRNVVVVDDIITTGATVDAAAAVLKRAGARRVDILALAMVVDPLQTTV